MSARKTKTKAKHRPASPPSKATTSTGRRARSMRPASKAPNATKRPARLGILAWHFLPRDRRLRYGDRRRAEKGVTLEAHGTLGVC
ncbi:hypothetical protein LCGC14_3094380, partial [marine sediment metagenome]